MTEYNIVNFKLSDSQLSKVRSAIKNNEGITIQVGLKNVTDNGNITLHLTNRQMMKIKELSSDKQV